ncbi:DUF58 domain-containing protein [Paenibacillus hodogayensis]|uniref:DUF58 domain-containing protein n=1 Tax=Paenibacillus hodogayensis TaxID=279208 RepID=A0ABV5W6U4_9BACL
MSGRWSWGNFAAVAALCAASYYLYEWRGGYSSAFLFHGTAALLVLSFVSLALGLGRVDVRRQLPNSRFFAGEDAHVLVTLQRGSTIPAGWLIVSDVWTDGLAERRYSRLLFPGFRSTMRFRYKLNRLARGQYRFLRMEVDAGDWIGLLRQKRVFPVESVFTVYPRPLPLQLYAHGTADDSERTAAPNRPENRSTPIVASIRAYAAGDPMQRIHWKASARTGTLQTKVSDPFESRKLAIVLNGTSAGQTDGELFETCVRAAAGLIEWAVRQGSTAGLLIGSAVPLREPFERRSDPVSAYELLSRARSDGVVAGAELLLRESAGWPHDCSVVYITAALDEPLVRAARMMRSGRRGLAVWLVRPDMPQDGMQSRFLQELETAGCRTSIIRSTRSHAFETGGADDVIA